MQAFIPGIRNIMIDHTCGEDRGPKRREMLKLLAQLLALSEEEIEDFALLMLVSAMTHLRDNPGDDLTLVHWVPCTGCGDPTPRVLARFELPLLPRRAPGESTH